MPTTPGVDRSGGYNPGRYARSHLDEDSNTAAAGARSPQAYQNNLKQFTMISLYRYTCRTVDSRPPLPTAWAAAKTQPVTTADTRISTTIKASADSEAISANGASLAVVGAALARVGRSKRRGGLLSGYAPSSGGGVEAALSPNAFASGHSQNCGNVITGRPSSRVTAPPGGHSTFS
ncbi:unnamed protein product, partial [Pylaiella littoralis]